MTMVNSFPEKMNLSFSGCGFLCIYHTGVAVAIKEYAPQLTENIISGASAGSIVAAALISGVCISKTTSTILQVVRQARSRAMGPLHPSFDLLGIVREQIRLSLPEDAYIKCNGRLQISLTRYSDSQNVVVTEYESNEELIDAIICSCHIPIYCGLIAPRYRGVQYIDGGFTDNQPEFDDHTVTVSPFAGESDICPPDWDSGSFFGFNFSKTSIRFTTRNLYRMMTTLMPPSTEECAKICMQGFDDALRFLTKNGMAPCIRCLTVQTINVPSPDGQRVIPVDDRRGMSPMSLAHRRKRSNSAMRTSRRYDSECETCCESDFRFSSGNTPSPTLPSLVQQTFDEAFAAEDSFFKYLLTFRMFRYARVALGVGKLPMDMFLYLTKSVLVSVSTVSTPAWIIERFTSLAEFVKSELDNQKSRYSMFSCQLALTELESKKGQHWQMEEKKFDIEMSEQARQEMETLRRRDKMKRKTARHKAPAEEVDWAALSAQDPDSFEQVVAYTKTHDSMYAFHYMDEDNKMRSVELFNISNPDKKHSCHSQCNHPPGVHYQRPMVLEEEECPPSVSGQDPEADSGVSGVENAERTAVAVEKTGKRDACCSPVRHFPSSSTTTSHRGSVSSRNKPTTRRHTTAGTTAGSSFNKARASLPRDVQLSSDSEIDVGERLFIPDRRMRRPSSDYDGEPEPSDTDADLDLASSSSSSRQISTGPLHK